jgi:hypothetical protein
MRTRYLFDQRRLMSLIVTYVRVHHPIQSPEVSEERFGSRVLSSGHCAVIPRYHIRLLGQSGEHRRHYAWRGSCRSAATKSSLQVSVVPTISHCLMLTRGTMGCSSFLMEGKGGQRKRVRSGGSRLGKLLFLTSHLRACLRRKSSAVILLFWGKVYSPGTNTMVQCASSKIWVRYEGDSVWRLRRSRG